MARERAELERCPRPERPEALEARKAAIRAICARTSARPEWQGRTAGVTAIVIDTAAL